MRPNLITRLKKEWNNLDPVDPLRGLIADAIDALADAQPSKPLRMWTEAQHERAYRNSPELHKDVKSLAAFKRVAKEIAAMYGIKGDA